MNSDKEKLLVVLVFARASHTIVVPGESQAVFEFSASLAKDVVEAVRTASVDVHPHAVAEYVVTRVNRFANAETRAAVIQESIDVGTSAAAFEQDALVALGLDGAGLRGQSELHGASNGNVGGSPSVAAAKVKEVAGRAKAKGRTKQGPEGVGAMALPGSASLVTPS